MRGLRPGCESLERRRLLAIVTVTNTSDTINGNTMDITQLIANPGMDGISLREAITAANNTANVGGADEIWFDIPGAEPHTIIPLTALPGITDPLVIDGTTEPDFAGTPMVELNGNGLAASGLWIRSAGNSSTVRGLVINRFGVHGVFLDVSHNNVVEGNYIGTSVAGSVDLGNVANGVFVSGVGNRIGGTDPQSRNVISGNNGHGIQANIISTGTVITGNYIGTRADGAAALGNALQGVSISGSLNAIGGVDPGARNVISGNGGGIALQFAQATNNTIEGNYIGVDATGTVAIANAANGVLIEDARDNVVGGLTLGTGNVISGNASGVNSAGVLITGPTATGNSVQGNFIGTDATGTIALPNRYGVSIWGAPSNTIGGTTSPAGNVISGNLKDGVWLDGNLGGGDIATNVVSANLIGPGAGGMIAIGNGGMGINVAASTAAFNTDNIRIGGTTAGQRNVISGSASHGIHLSGASNMYVQGNWIGVAGDGLTPMGNLGHGVLVSGNATFVRIGRSIGDGTSAGNLIAHNWGSGVTMQPLGVNVPGQNGVRGNSIHSNGWLGIDLGADGVTANDIGDADTGVNQLQNYPVISSAVLIGGSTIINGSLNSTASAAMGLDFFAVSVADSSGFGEGATLLTTLDAATNSSGNLNFSLTLPVALTVGTFVSATASSIIGTYATSEFSQAVQVVEAPSFAIDDVAIIEGNAGTVSAVFTVHRTGNSSITSSILYTTAPDTAGAPDDYVHIPTTLLNFAPGETSKTITVLVKGDTISEPNETFVVNLSGAVNATIGDAQAVGTITNDDADLSPPAVLASSFNFVGFLPTPYEMQFQLNEPVVASPGGVPVLIRRADNGQLVATVMASIQNETVVLGQMTAPLADGNYRATLPAGAVIDLSGNPLAQDVDVNFFILAADANRDRIVDTQDFNLLAGSFGTSGKVFSDGNFDYDANGNVDSLDFNILTGQYGKTLPAPAAAPAGAPNGAFSASPLFVGQEEESSSRPVQLIILVS